MNKKMMDILVCPIDKQFPLEIFEAESKDEIVVEGALYCNKCSRFYPIIEEIPIMLPDELRDKKQDMEFLDKNQKKLPEKIIKHAKPWHV
ncbi:Trm112 family protein [Candidatus Nitrosotenuis chungbukensis]|uniref:Trm112 family protein n=1 Tax=Candidatus Nitrosotenuis chungbukensis TaxID=1353246 RepID=UPI0005B28FD9|nr:Trm112 family protein [Candidatus Nitrosotenuis chungbukensis]WKT58208.1 Trm112 family protein [Candidatus Nitrosotenuis chungbukensis]